MATNNYTTTISVRVRGVSKKRLGALAKGTGRSRAYLAAQAIDEYLDVNDWQVGRITKAMASLARGKGISHARVKSWVASWGKSRESRAPRAA